MSLKSKIQALITAANAKTGETDATLTDAVQTLVDGYGGITPSGSITLTEENTYDVTDKATAVVDMSATRANLAEAVTAKGVDTLPTSSFDTIATNIGLISGGGSLPSSISKIDGGSFTVASDTDVRGYFISHNLGVAPKGYRIWCPEMFNDLSDQTQPSLLFLFVISNIDLRWGSRITNGYCNGMVRKATGGGVGQPNRDIDMQWFSESHIGIPSNASEYYSYLAGKTYKWIAWA